LTFVINRTYVFDQHEVERTIATIRDANFDTEDDNQRAQAAHARILIPSYIMPTITLEQSRLLGIRYFIQVKILENDGIYTTVDGKHLQYMMVDLPFTVGTLRTPSNSSSLSEPISVPLLRTPSNSSSLSEPISVPSLAHQYLTKTPPSISSSVHSSSTTSISLTRTPPSISSSIHSSSTTSISLTSIYRRFTQSSGSLNERRSRKRDLFQSLRNSKRNSDPSTLQVHGRNNLMMNQEDDDSISSVKLQNQVPPTVLVEPKSSKVDISLNIAAEKGAFDIIAGDGINDIEEAKPEKKPVVSSEIKKEESCVFKMFPDDDDDDDDEPDTIQSQTASNSKYISRKEAVFKIFCDGEEDEDSDAENIASAKDEHEQLIDAINDRIESFVNDQQYKKQSNVFKMFNDDDSSSEEEAVIDAPVKSRLEEPRYHKPNEYI
jgi:hypothetical protein